MALAPELKDRIDQTVQGNRIVAFIKGTKDFPMCGFSDRAVKMLTAAGAADFRDVNILEDEELRWAMKEYSEWPTFPQIYIDGEFLGGCDILTEMYESGELQEKLKSKS